MPEGSFAGIDARSSLFAAFCAFESSVVRIVSPPRVSRLYRSVFVSPKTGSLRMTLVT